MKINRYLAILVFLGSAAWIATGEFSFVGSAAGNEENLLLKPHLRRREPKPAALQTVGVAVIPQISMPVRSRFPA
jgi:multidrug efflux system membrane fusion protein